jgi:hypothetical protein
MSILLLLVSVLVLSMGDGADPDLWGHVRYGQDVLATGKLPATATYTFTAVGHPWINHENAAELLFAFIANHAGGPGLMVLKDLLALVVVGLMLRTASRRGVSLLPTALTIALVGWSVSPGWSVRPQTFTYTLPGQSVTTCSRLRAWPRASPSRARTSAGCSRRSRWSSAAVPERMTRVAVCASGSSGRSRDGSPAWVGSLICLVLVDGKVRPERAAVAAANATASSFRSPVMTLIEFAPAA